MWIYLSRGRPLLFLHNRNTGKSTLISAIIIPHATSCGGYNVFDLSVSQSVRQSCFSCWGNSSEFWKFGQNEIYYSTQFVSATPLKQLNRISWHFVVMKDIMCTCAHPQEILIPFFSRSYALFELRNLAKMKDTSQHSLLAQLLWNRSTEFRETL